MSKEVNNKSSVRKRGVKELLGGIGIGIAGGIATYISYNSARPGGSYTVYTGIIAIGVVYAFKGLYDIVFPAGFGKKSKTDSAQTSASAEQPKATAEAEIVKEED